MKLTIFRDTFARALSTVGKSIPSRSSLPVLSNVLLTAAGARLTLTATNLETATTAQIEASVDQPGAYTLPYKLLSDWIAAGSGEHVTIEQDGTKAARLTAGTSTATMHGIEADEYPSIPEAHDAETFTIAGATLAQGLGAVLFAAATDDSRPVLFAAHLRTVDSGLQFEATDGFSLARTTVPQRDGPYGAIDAILPSKALEQVRALAAAAETVDVTLGQNIARFETPHATLTTRILEGKFPDVDRILPTEHTVRAVVSRTALLQALKQARTFADQAARIVTLGFTPATETPGTIGLVSTAAEIGDGAAVLDADVTGDELRIALNVAFLTEAVGAVTTERVVLEARSPAAPLVVRPLGSDTTLTVLMPVTVRS